MEALLLSTILLTWDWGQTRGLAVDPQRYEANLALGKHPSLTKVDLYFGAVLVGNAAIGFSLPKHKYRRTYWYSVAAMQAGVVWNNDRIGVKVNWRF